MALDWDVIYDPLASAYLGPAQAFDKQGNPVIHHHHHHHHNQIPLYLDTNATQTQFGPEDIEERQVEDTHLTEDNLAPPNGPRLANTPSPVTTQTVQAVAHSQSLARKIIPVMSCAPTLPVFPVKGSSAMRNSTQANHAEAKLVRNETVACNEPTSPHLRYHTERCCRLCPQALQAESVGLSANVHSVQLGSQSRFDVSDLLWKHHLKCDCACVKPVENLEERYGLVNELPADASRRRTLLL